MLGGGKFGLPAPRDGFTPQQIDLGRLLFLDPTYQKMGQYHVLPAIILYKGFADGMAVTIGVDGAVQTRSAPTLWNVAYLNSFFWDGRAHDLEKQIQRPMYSPIEMGNTRQQLLASINKIENYIKLFQEAFPSQKNESIELDEIYVAIAAFKSSLISVNSRYDQYAHGFADALNENEIARLNIFRSFVARCRMPYTS